MFKIDDIDLSFYETFHIDIAPCPNLKVFIWLRLPVARKVGSKGMLLTSIGPMIG